MGIMNMIGGVLKAADEYAARRTDGDLVTRIHPYRKMMSFMMPGRNESVVYFDDYPRAENMLAYIDKASKKWGMEVDITHVLVAASGLGMHTQTKMNQFVVGKRLYHRNHVAITFSMKRQRMNKEAKLSAVKLRFDDPSESFESICRRINDQVNYERSGEKTYTDKELDLLTVLPRPVLSKAMGVVRTLDYYNLLPHKFIENDAFYTSMFIANLGSLGMGAGYHHLYEYGTCPLFMMVGKIEEKAVVEDGKIVPRKILHIRWSYDERIDDGLTSKYGIQWVHDCVADPEKMFGPID